MPARPIIERVTKNTQGRKYLLPIVVRVSQYFAKQRYNLIKDHLKGKRILDIGLGMGTLAMLMREDDYKVVGVDVDNTSLYQNLQPILYEGDILPFKRKSFDVATLICVLHHCGDQRKVLNEAMRVAGRVIIIEDTYRNKVEKLLVAFRDSLENWEWYTHEYHSYREWSQICRGEGWKVKHIKSWSSFDFGFLYGRQSLFIVESGS